MLTASVDRTSGGSFRPDIEGLRAVAVAAVVLYHLRFSAAPGGFIGVDVFFTISGFLMAEIICRDIDRGKFSVWQFYRRRILRIWPAMLLVMLVTILVGLYSLLPLQLIELAKAAASSLVLANNVLFWVQSGYFAPAAENNLLLHLWSLAVEQQFYLLMPFLMLIAFAGRRRDRRWLVVAIAIASLMLCVVMTPRKPVASFYLLPGRVWEFLLGSAVALYGRELRDNPALGEIASGIGLAMIVAAAIGLSGGMSFPGYWALLPCVGTALVIAANARAPTLVGRVLAASPFVMVGRLSYSIYLWHWPLLTFARLWGISIDGWAARLAILAATLGCAYVSWRFVEVPFRTSAALPSRVRFVALAGGAFSLAAISGVAVATEGLPVRLDKDIRGMLAYQSYPPKPALYREGACFLRLDQPAADFDESKCADRQPGRADLLLWGDSHAAHYAPGMRQEARRFDINVVQATYAGCPPIPFRAGISASCADFGKRIWQMAQTEKFDAIVLSANWTGYQAVLPELSGVVRELAQTGRPVVVIGPSVEFSSALPVLLSARRPGAGTHLRQAGGWLLKAAVDLDVRMRELFGAIPNVLYVSPISEVCPDRVCPVLLENGVPLTWDSSHLTAEGSALVSALLLKRMSSVVRRQGLQADHSKL